MSSSKNKRLLDEVRDVMRLKHYSIHTERYYCEQFCHPSSGKMDYVLRLKYKGLAISMDFPDMGLMEKKEDGFGFRYLCGHHGQYIQGDCR